MTDLLALNDKEISIHSLPKEGDSHRNGRWQSKGISIHSLPKEGDRHQSASQSHLCISIHSLPKEGDRARTSEALRLGVFQSTPSPRRETEVNIDIEV